MRRSFVSLIVVTQLLIMGSSASGDELDLLEKDIETLYLGMARSRIDGMDREVVESPRGKYLNGKLLFFEGECDRSAKVLRSAIEGARTEIAWKNLRDRVELAKSHIEVLEEKEGESGNFVFRYAKGVDSILVPYADEALTRQLEALADLFGDRPSYKIQVLLLPDTESMSAVSGLTVEQIERTGTVGVSKHGKVMVLTPRALATGYPWLDTLAHELTHLFISRASQDRAPIWLQEGFAKLLESRWRGKDTAELTPQEAYLLDRAAKERRLIPLRRFHPSVALLPSQEDAALAYAQVLSFMQYLEGRFEGGDWMAKTLTIIGEGKSMDDAFVEVSRFNVRRLYLWWQQTASGKRQTPVPAVGLMKRKYQQGAPIGDGQAESVLDTDVRRHVRIGDLLRLRGHVGPAAAEYRKALALADANSPEISDRLGGCLIEQKRYEEVVNTLEPMSLLYPSHSTVFVQLGEALVRLEKHEEAAEKLEQARAVNPFQPKVHCMLARAYRALGKDRRAELETTHCRLLSVDQSERGSASGDEK